AQGPRRRGHGIRLVSSCRSPSHTLADAVLRTPLPTRLPCRSRLWSLHRGDFAKIEVSPRCSVHKRPLVSASGPWAGQSSALDRLCTSAGGTPEHFHNGA